MGYVHTIHDGRCTVCGETAEWLEETGQTNVQVLEVPPPLPSLRHPDTPKEDH